MRARCRATTTEAQARCRKGANFKSTSRRKRNREQVCNTGFRPIHLTSAMSVSTPAKVVEVALPSMILPLELGASTSLRDLAYTLFLNTVEKKCRS